MSSTLPVRRRAIPVRQLWVAAHRCAGLTIALFLIVAGLTGAAMPFKEALTLLGRPSLARATPPTPGAAPLDALTIAERVERETGLRVPAVNLDVPRGHVFQMGVTGRPGERAPAYDSVWADPYSGAVRLTYRWGDLREGPQNLMPFLYRLHYGDAAGRWGRKAFGIAALIWTLDCLVAFCLTLPPGVLKGALAGGGAGWLRRWRSAWTVRPVGGHKLVFDLHRAGGLWLWPILLVFAWSAVSLTLPRVEGHVMRVLGPTRWYQPADLPQPLLQPAITPRQALALGERELVRRAAQDGFRYERATRLAYDPATGLYSVFARTSLDVLSEGGDTKLMLDGRDGHVAHFAPPFADGRAATANRWLAMLHMAQVFGLPYRILVSALGLAVTALSVTGVMIWMRRRAARLAGGLRPRRWTLAKA